MAGSGVHEKRAKIYTAERRAKLDAANEKRRATIAAKKAKADAARLAERRIEQVEIEARFPETFAILNPIIKSIERDDDVETVSDFAVVTARRWIAGEEVSDERLEKVVEVVEKFETAKREREAREQIEIDRKANATHVATIAGNGVELRGQILSIQNRVSGYNGDNVAKMLFQDERGFRLWGTVPTALHIEIRERIFYFIGSGQRSWLKTVPTVVADHVDT